MIHDTVAPTVKKRYPSAIMATCVVPWTSSYRFDEPCFREQVRDLAQNLTPHLYIFGTAGEGYAVTDTQFERIARVFFEECTALKAAPTLGIISLSLGTILERIERGRTWGFRRFQISLPAWGALNDRELAVFFRETCGRFRDSEFMHYNLLRTKRLVSPAEYRRFATDYENLVAAKNTRDDPVFLKELLEAAPQLQHFLGEAGFARMRDSHECGLLISLASSNFTRAHEFFAARGPQLAQMSDELKAALDALKRAVGSNAHMDGAFDKLLYKARSPGFPLRLLPPYESSEAATALERYSEAMRQLAPAWLS